MSQPTDQFYQAKWKKVVNVLKNSNLGISRIAQAGSRAKQRHRPNSDQDVIIAVSDNPTKTEFYPDLIGVLESNFPSETVYLGSNNKVVHLDFTAGGKFDLVLLSEGDFDRQHQGIKDYRRSNL